MVYDDEFTIVNRCHNIPVILLIGDDEITVVGQIMGMVLDFINILIENYILYRLTINY